MTLVELEGVGVRRGGRAILQDVSLTVEEGERVVLMGPNGVGKSTLLDVVLGLVAHDGEARVLGGEPSRHVGYVPQDPGASLLPWFTVRRNLLLPLEARGERDESALGAVCAALDPGGTVDMDARPNALSGGQRQRAALMRAFIGRPRLVVCDEPFSAIDAPSRARLREALLRSCEAEEAPAILVVTHDTATALAIATKIVLLGGAPARLAAELDPRAPGAAAELSRRLAAA